MAVRKFGAWRPEEERYDGSAKKRATQAAHREAHREEHHAWSKAWYEANKEHVQAYQRQWWKKNRIRLNARARERYRQRKLLAAGAIEEQEEGNMSITEFWRNMYECYFRDPDADERTSCYSDTATEEEWARALDAMERSLHSGKCAQVWDFREEARQRELATWEEGWRDGQTR